MSHTQGIRQVRKQKTRQALLDAALLLLEEQSLSGLGLREVTRAAGVAPTAFYRHFRDPADLGVALVEQALDSLHGTIGAILTATDGDEERIDRTVRAMAEYVRAYPAHVRFIARERHGGVRPVREAIAAQLRRFSEEVASALAAEPVSAGWSPDDLRMLADVYVDQTVMTASAFLDAAEHRPETERHPETEHAPEGEHPPETAAEAERRVVSAARHRLRLIALGRRHWLN
ncbi:TetR family transcriptional regulator [Streptomyces sp. NPDC059255]|uniref:TetR family transcriptional regulator n=1 Tax=Streptomyces sp. NPDC059255 TaxID=3346793 RepID=UPI0036876365